MQGFWKSKPPAGVDINRGHHLAKGLARCWLWNEGSGSAGRDLVQGERAALGTSGEYRFSPTGRGAAISCAAAAANSILFANAVDTTTTFTLEQWWYFRSFPVNYHSILGTIPGEGFFVKAGVLDYYYGGDHLATTTLVTGRWYHIAFSVSAGAGTFYLNGVADGTAAAVTTKTLAQIGSDQFTSRVDGWNALTRIWIGRALLPSDVTQLYADPYGMFRAPMWAVNTGAFAAGEPPQGFGTYTQLERFHPRGLERGMYP